MPTRVQAGSANGAGSATITLGSAPVAGNVALLVVELGDSLAKINTPAGYTPIGAGIASGTAQSCLAFIRVLTGSEGTSLPISTTSTFKVRAEYVEYSGVDTTTPYANTSGVGYLYTTSASGVKSITLGPITPGAGSKVLMAAAGEATAATSATSWSGGFTEVANTDTNRGVAADLAATADGSTAYSTTYSFTSSSANGGAGVIVALNAVTASGLTLGVGRASSPGTVKGANVGGSGSTTLGVARPSSPATAKGATVTASGSTTLGVARPSSPASARGATVTASGIAPLGIARASTPATLRGASVLGTGTASLGAGRVSSPARVRGLALLGSTTLGLGRVTAAPLVRGLGVSATGTATLGVARGSSVATLRGVALSHAAPLVLTWLVLTAARAHALDLSATAPELVLEARRVYNLDLKAEPS